MILSDFLSRQKHDDRNPHDIIPVSFNMHTKNMDDLRQITGYTKNTCKPKHS